ncbi:MAG: MFS transporter [Acidobacteriota bacterium]
MPVSAARLPQTDAAFRGSLRNIFSYVFFTFICYLSIGLPLAVLPPFVHLQLGYSALIAGLAISIQYVATLFSRPWAGRISDQAGAKISVMWGMGSIILSGLLVIATAELHAAPWISFAVLIASRLALGVGESLVSTGSTLWGITAAGPENTAKVIGYNGISTYGGVAAGAPLGVILHQLWGLSAIGLLTAAMAVICLLLAMRRPSLASEPGEHMPFSHVLGRVAPHGAGLALGGLGYSVIATFITLFYAHQQWSGAALCLTAFGGAFILARVFFIGTIRAFGGFPVAKASLLIEAVGALVLWRCDSPWTALAGSAIVGLGFSLVFPSIGVEAVERVPEFNRGTALGVYTAFADVSFFMTGPIAGALIGWYGYPSAFLFTLISILVALGIVFALQARRRSELARLQGSRAPSCAS